MTPEVVAPVFESMVDLCDHGDLLETFLALPMRRTFVHGEQNAHLGYLDEHRRHDVNGRAHRAQRALADALQPARPLGSDLRQPRSRRNLTDDACG